MNKSEQAQKTAVLLRRLADRYERIGTGEIKEHDKEVTETRMLAKLVRRILNEDWL